MMLKRVAVLIFLLLANCSSAEAGRKSASADLRPRLDAQLEANGRQYGIPAQSVLIMHNGKVLYRKQTGLADVESNRPVRANDIYGAYSVSKLFLSTLVFELVDEGRLDLAAPVGRYVAEVPEAWRQVSVEQLLNHASGLPDFFEGPESLVSFPPTRDELFRSLAGRPFYFQPGTQSRYTQTNYVLLQAVLEELHGRSYRDIVRRRIVEPLGLRNVYLGYASAPKGRLVTAYAGKGGVLVRDRIIPWQDYSIAHAELFTTADDLGRFLTAVAQGRFARQETLLRLWRPYRLADGSSAGFAAGWDYGAKDGLVDVGHDGGIKVRVRLLFCEGNLSDSYVIIYLTNGSRENVWTRTLVESLEKIILPSAPVSLPCRRRP
jgi:D-alanyl-D-alanine carboxypeptidase